MNGLLAMEYLDLTRAESVIKRNDEGTHVAYRILLQAHVMKGQCMNRIAQISGIDLRSKCPNYPPKGLLQEGGS